VASLQRACSSVSSGRQRAAAQGMAQRKRAATQNDVEGLFGRPKKAKPDFAAQVAQLHELGFAKDQCEPALVAALGDSARAVEYLLNGTPATAAARAMPSVMSSAEPAHVQPSAAALPRARPVPVPVPAPAPVPAPVPAPAPVLSSTWRSSSPPLGTSSAEPAHVQPSAAAPPEPAPAPAPAPAPSSTWRSSSPPSGTSSAEPGRVEPSAAAQPVPTPAPAPPPSSRSPSQPARAAVQPPRTRALTDQMNLRPELRVLKGALFDPRVEHGGALSRFRAKQVNPAVSVAEAFAGRHGIVLLRGFLTRAQCEEVVKATDEVSLTLPLTIPAVKNSYDGSNAFSNVWMTFAGLVWDGRNKKKMDGYKECSEDWSKDGLVVNAAPVPLRVKQFAEMAIEKAIAEHPGCFDHKGWKCTAAGWSKGSFTTIFNYYVRQSWSKLSAHQDDQEPSLGKNEFWPVVSFSVGDSATFSFYDEYKSSKSPGPATTVELHSGDVLLFGGDSRLVPHSVGCPSYGKRQDGLKMVEGRLNVTLRRL
jgi:hypothetical protein